MTAPYDVGDVIEARRKYNDGLASAGRRERATWFPWALAAILAVLPLMQLTGGGYNYLIHIVLYAMMYAAMASSWNILGGYTGYISLGHNVFFCIGGYFRSEEHTSELQSLMRISYAVFCLKKKKINNRILYDLKNT